MKWGLAAAMASAAAVAAASGAELLACDCDASAPVAAPAATVGRCDGLVLSRQHHDDEVHEVRLPRIKDSWSPLSRLARFTEVALPSSRFTFRQRIVEWNQGWLIATIRACFTLGILVGVEGEQSEWRSPRGPVRAAVRRPALHRDARHGAPLKRRTASLAAYLPLVIFRRHDSANCCWWLLGHRILLGQFQVSLFLWCCAVRLLVDVDGHLI